ncbi:hypothetical protein IT084_06035 [Desulfallas sp. Bu1-1]|jgi:hypothetical protein|nr:hypothetical protein [Desulfallas sp. Bu1-1]MBF7082538.1 hypothetical protein [Desulfallas sp. Bu1-1]
MKEKRNGNRKPKVAPGSEDILQQKATREEIRKGDFTRVTRLSYDETD